ncbi:hypothetical protein SAMN02745194_04030 [Roseomonas rosea]|uniref:Anti-sigma factor NepR domain-containing protein n=1 Tax=Muricoccus roseus TaxID=198092 RepID=A0A1M6P858_9PROT|nr:hypothetical protein [Roseomonas rosea]SHK04161.1 hypothetical protein SAMN02745194_04030 [Roseomonas rosea]
MPLGPARRNQGFSEADPFDLWLRRSLHQSWDGALDEPVPDDLLRLFSDGRGDREALRTRWLRAEKEPRQE